MCIYCFAPAAAEVTAPSITEVRSQSVAISASSDTIDAMATYLTTGYWQDQGISPHAFAANVIEVNTSALDSAGRAMAWQALEAWASVADLIFVEGGAARGITFSSTQSGAYANARFLNGEIRSAFVNISADWQARYGEEVGSYTYQTYLHEIGHALGLGHQGNYNGGASYGQDAVFAHDSYQLSVMSYFSQTENPLVGASYALAVTPMAVDIAAIQSLYGAPGDTSASAGDTRYALDGLATQSSAMQGMAAAGVAITMTLYDVSGQDMLDFSAATDGIRLDLRGGAVSDVAGLAGNLVIAQGTVIEDARSGVGNDLLRGNIGDNRLAASRGNDVLFGHGGSDTLIGAEGRDRLSGGIGADRLLGGAHMDKLWGGTGRDTLAGGGGDDLLSGGGGADLLFGGTGDDVLTGGGGADRLFGQEGQDTLSGGAGFDRLWGGAGADCFVYRAGFANDWILDFSVSEGDRLQIYSDAATEGDLAQIAAIEGDDTNLTFETGTLRLIGYTDLAALAGQIDWL